jgi:hypothetical protein
MAYWSWGYGKKKTFFLTSLHQNYHILAAAASSSVTVDNVFGALDKVVAQRTFPYPVGTRTL